MEPWIALTLSAAFCQNPRSLLQRWLTAKLSPDAASYARFRYGLPFAVGFIILLLASGNPAPPAPRFDRRS